MKIKEQSIFPNTRYYQLPQSLILKLPEHNAVSVSLASTQELGLVQAFESDSMMLEGVIRIFSERPSRRVLQGVKGAQNEILKNVESKAHTKNMRVYFLHPEAYERFFENDTLGKSSWIMRGVVVKKDSRFPDYFLCMAAFHELCHRWSEIFVNLISEKNDIAQDKRNIYFQDVRRGLDVRKHSTSEEKRNNFLNELFACGWQSKFILHLFSDEKLKKLFRDEIAQRNLLLREKEIHDEGALLDVKITLEDIGDIRFLLHKDMVFFDKNGDLIWRESVLIMQMFHDIEYLYNNSKEGDSLFQDFLSAMKNPKSQQILREKLNAIFGKGFYEKLKRTSGTFIEYFEIVKIIQKKAYNFE